MVNMKFFSNLTTLPAELIAFILLIIFLFVLNNYGNIKQRKKKKLQNLKLKKPEEAHGILFGKKGKNIVCSPEEREGHVLVSSSSGAGKTSSIAIPTIRSWTGPCFVIDISGDIFKNCPDITHKLIYDYNNPKTTPYNIFGTIDQLNNPAEQNESLAQLAFLLMPEKPGMNENAAFFYKNGRSILIATLIAFYHKGNDFPEIMQKIANSSWQELFQSIDSSKNSDAITFINGFVGSDPKNTAGCFQSLQDNLSLFLTNKKIQNTIRRPNGHETYITPKDIESNTIFCVIPEEKLMMLSPLMNIMTSQIMEYISQRSVTEHSKTILLVLDEFASLMIDSNKILEGVRRFRKRKCRIMILTQNICDFDVLYQNREITRAILSNLKFKVLLGGGGLGDLESQRYFADVIGTKETKKRGKSRNAKSITITESISKEYIIEPAELDRLDQDTVLLIAPTEGNGFLLLKKNYFFKK